MHLSEVFSADMVWPELKADSKEGVIRELSDLIAQHEPALNADTLHSVLLDREKLGSTGIEDGVALPHAKVPGLSHIIVACGRSTAGIDFDAHDGKNSHLFFVLLAPMHATGMHLKVLARLSRLLKEARVRCKLMDAHASHELYNTLIEEDKDI